MVAALAVIGFVVLLLIYFVLKGQSLQRELGQTRYSLKSSDKQKRQLLGVSSTLAGELQKTYIARLASAQKHGLLSQEDFEVANQILSQFDYVVMRCCEHNATVEEAIKKSVERQAGAMENINQFIAKQPNEIKLPWCKNQLGGYITACHNISLGKMNQKAAEASVSSQ